VRSGDGFSAEERWEIERAVADAERVSGHRFAVYVGSSDGDARAYAERLHAGLEQPTDSVLVALDPGARRLEIVTGSQVRRTLTDRQAALAAITMQTTFETGDLVRGLCAGISQLAQLSRAPRTLHTETP
jgi:uncharacterized membrane protein YgcG